MSKLNQTAHHTAGLSHMGLCDETIRGFVILGRPAEHPDSTRIAKNGTICPLCEGPRDFSLPQWLEGRYGWILGPEAEDDEVKGKTSFAIAQNPTGGRLELNP
jgi:hypothetical protein